MADVIPTIVPASFADLEEKAAKLGAFAPALHIDAADGMFAPNATWIPSNETLPKKDSFYYEAHLMVTAPREKGIAFAQAGAKRIIAHVEAFENADAVFAAFDAWRDAGAKEVGLALLLETPLARVEPFVPQCDVVHLMTIAAIGTQGIPFDERALPRIQELRRTHTSTIIAVDGGVSEANITALAHAGASRFCVGSALAGETDARAVYNRLVEKAHAI